MLRAILTACLLALGAPAWADQLEVGDQPTCPDKEYVIAYMQTKFPGTTYVLYTGVDGSAIKAAIHGATATEFLVFAKPGGGDRRMIVGFRDGCMEDAAPVSVRTIDHWLAGQEAWQ